MYQFNLNQEKNRLSVLWTVLGVLFVVTSELVFSSQVICYFFEYAIHYCWHFIWSALAFCFQKERNPHYILCLSSAGSPSCTRAAQSASNTAERKAFRSWKYSHYSEFVWEKKNHHSEMHICAWVNCTSDFWKSFYRWSTAPGMPVPKTLLGYIHWGQHFRFGFIVNITINKV